jgi:Protein of unknown function (DUF3800)
MTRVLNFYMDDSGTRKPNRKPLAYSPKVREFFALGGILINEEDEGSARKLYSDFCARWSIGYPLHSVEIRHSSANFGWLRRKTDEYQRFMNDIGRLLTTVNVTGLACVIDRPGYDGRYSAKYGRRQWQLCRTAFCIAVERAAKYARRDLRKLRVMPERSCRDDEKRLAGYFSDMRKTGAPFDAQASTTYQPLSAEELHATLYELRFKNKSSPMAQIADLFLWPMAVNGYDENYRPYVMLKEAGRLIECRMESTQHASCGTKYSCFELAEHEKRGA